MKLARSDKSYYYIFIFFAISEVLSRAYIPIVIPTLFITIALYFWIYRSFKQALKPSINSQYNATTIIFLFLLWNLIIIIRGVIDSNDYWDYKNVLINKGPFLLFSTSIFLTSRVTLLKAIFRFLLKYYLILSLFFIQPIFMGNTGRIICNLIPLACLFAKKYKYFLVAFTIISIPLSWGARGWTLRAFFGLFLFFICSMRLKNLIKDNLLNFIFKILYIVFICVPLTFVYLGYTGKFNLFAISEYINTNSKSENEDLVDTRSFLYQAVNAKLQKSNQEWIGLGGVSEYLEGWYENSEDKNLQKKGRNGTESGILNMYLYGGWIGATLFSLLFWMASFYGIFKSQNLVCKFSGLYILFRWVISFVDEPEIWLCSNLMMYFFMGICFNKKLRNVSDTNWIQWFKSIK